MISRIDFAPVAGAEPSGPYRVTFYSRIGFATYTVRAIVGDLSVMQKATDEAIDTFSELARKLSEARAVSAAIH